MNSSNEIIIISLEVPTITLSLEHILLGGKSTKHEKGEFPLNSPESGQLKYSNWWALASHRKQIANMK